MCELELDAARARARCSCAWPRPASATPTCTSPTATSGDGRHPIVLGHEGAGIVEAVGEEVDHVAPGDPVAFCFVPACGDCAPCAAGRRNLCETADAHAFAGTLLDGTLAPAASPDGEPVQHFNFISCFAERCVVPAASAVPIPAALPLWQASLLGCGVVTAVGAVRNAARVGVGETVCVIGCGGVGLQLVAAARLAGAAARDRASSATRRSGRWPWRAARRDAVPGPAMTPVAAVLALAPGGVDHAFEAVGSPATIRLAWDVLRAGRDRHGRRDHAGRASRWRCPRWTCSPRRGSAAATTARATPAEPARPRWRR